MFLLFITHGADPLPLSSLGQGTGSQVGSVVAAARLCGVNQPDKPQKLGGGTASRRTVLEPCSRWEIKRR